MIGLQLVGQRYGRLVVIAKYEGPLRTRKGTWWECRCDCGNVVQHAADVLRRCVTRSCGCLAAEARLTVPLKHGMEKTRTYKSWSSMKERCDNSNAPNFPRYGGRGISYCERWAAFENFFADMGERPERTTLGRIDNDGNYEPSNCEWQGVEAQQRNKSNTKLSVEIAQEIRRAHAGGERKYLIAKRLGVSFSNVKDVIDNRCWL